MMNINPHDHYWIHEDGQTVFSSAREMEVPVDDEAYQAWLAEDEERAPTPYPTDEAGAETVAALEVVLARYYPPVYSGAAARRAAEIQAELAGLDKDGERAVQELLDPSISAEDKTFSEGKLSRLNARKAELRAELAELGISA